MKILINSEKNNRNIKSVYLGGSNEQHGKNDPDYNNQEITDKTVGATGRSTDGKVE
ncbi:hypothetical protein [Neobacillus niacini]|uniref:hypothetical protein n=1 Tax=Neobacillus niacini TaxID=86668 RepID=UPI002FFEAF29